MEGELLITCVAASAAAFLLGHDKRGELDSAQSASPHTEAGVMNVDSRFAQAFASLDIADEAVRELQKSCCQPLKSPRMETLTSTLAAARAQLADASHDAEVARDVVAILQDAGAQLGHLQVDCCAPARMKLYATTLENLSKIQRLLKRTFGLEH